MNPATLWGLVAALVAVVAEYLYRTLPGPWLRYLYLWVPFQLTIGYSIYMMVRSSSSLLSGFVVWAFATTLMRVFVSFVILREQIAVGTWIALGFIVLAKLAQSVWGR